MSKMDDSVKPTDGEMKDLEAVMNDPAERAKILIAPQRPHYLRRKSMEGIIVGRVFELKMKYDAMALVKELKNKN